MYSNSTAQHSGTVRRDLAQNRIRYVGDEYAERSAVIGQSYSVELCRLGMSRMWRNVVCVECMISRELCVH